VNNNLNGCYGTIYNDKTSNLFDEDYDGRMQFNGKNNLANYITKVYGKAADKMTPSNMYFTRNSGRPVREGSSSGSNATSSTSGTTSGGISGSVSGGTSSSVSGGVSITGVISGNTFMSVDVNINQVITVTQVSVLSSQWTVSYGNPLQNPVAPNGQTFVKNDFAVPVPGSAGQNSFKGTIQSIQGYTCTAVDDQKVPYTLYFSGGTSIQAVNKPVPEVGDTIYWLGSVKPGGKSTDYNVNQCICY
jgi:hypothetical protein